MSGLTGAFPLACNRHIIHNIHVAMCAAYIVVHGKLQEGELFLTEYMCRQIDICTCT